MDDSTHKAIQKATQDVEFITLVSNVIKLHAPEEISKRFRKASDGWLAGSSRFDKLLDIVPLPGNPHPAVHLKNVLMAKRNDHIQEAGILCIRPSSMNRTLLNLISEIETFSPVMDKYREHNFSLYSPNPYWTEINTNLYWAFRFHFECSSCLFPTGKTQLREILKENKAFRSNLWVTEKDLTMFELGHGCRAKKTV